MERNEAIEVVKKNWPDNTFTRLREALETLIPELAESEDERMVVKIARTLSFAAAHNLITDYDELIAMQNWLEKQKEQKPIPANSVGLKEQKPEWSEEDEQYLLVCKNALNKYQRSDGWDAYTISTWLEKKLESLRLQPKAELTLLDKNIIEAAVAFVEQNNHFNYWGGIDKHTVIKALRSLKPCWKPSEEQDYSGLSDLERAIHRGFLCAGVENVPVAIIKETAKEVLVYAKEQLLSYADESNPAIEAMADLERTFECNPDKLPIWLKNELAKKHLDGYIMGREETMRKMSDFLKSHFNGEDAKGPNPPAINIPTWAPPCYYGGPCTNPQMDCIICPMRTTEGRFSTSSGTSTSKAEG